MPNWFGSLKNRFLPSQRGNHYSFQEKCTYKPLDLLFREDVHTVALKSLSQGEQQILQLDRASSYPIQIKNLEQENRQYKAWTDSILAVLQKLKEEGVALKITKAFQWKNSVEAVLQDLRSENDILVEENKKKKETIRSLLYHLEEIKQGVFTKNF